MKKLINWQLALCIGLISLMACGDDGIIDVLTVNDRLDEDLKLIDEYITEKGYTSVDTTSSRVRYVILEEGDGEIIEFNDIVSMNYVGMFLNDTVFDTSIKTVAIENDLFSETRTYAPYTFTHTQSGWGIEQLGFIQGFSDGSTAALSKMKVGGMARLIIPSSLAYGTTGNNSIASNTIIVFDVYPVKVRK